MRRRAHTYVTLGITYAKVFANQRKNVHQGAILRPGNRNCWSNTTAAATDSSGWSIFCWLMNEP
ncbi:hypothetical protein NC796_12535 [Aliifodinibius sp. S!AR15-10]|uniref:hypothetical protein n=1 Tax=Aliifodinibius sp. S!AR15-10 TaxID=2950437 RepID=UPI002862F9C9|nr:hypothetical protein [Aliifodinibius sp. S!AR15-10]MDR8391977.1 hypothetical protein [Aliifodinibius sp. S!AR15-10]